MVTTITREMFSIIVDGPRAEIRIWRRPDLDSAKGAANALELASEGARLSAQGVREVLLDVRTAPAVAGPRTGEALSGMLEVWEASRIRAAVLVSADPLMGLQFRRLVSQHAPKYARVSAEPAQAEKWLVTGT